MASRVTKDHIERPRMSWRQGKAAEAHVAPAGIRAHDEGEPAFLGILDRIGRATSSEPGPLSTSCSAGLGMNCPTVTSDH